MHSSLYEHRQVSWIPWLAALAIAAMLAVGWVMDPGIATAAWLVALLAATVIVAFGSLTVAVDHAELRWHFGPGVWRKRVPLSDIQSVEVTRTRFWDGWAIRWTRRGWLYNVAGLDAVLVRRRDGKAVLIGSDEAQRLAAALEGALPGRR